MRLSEKTIELNLCSQISKHCRRRIIWFGLTQKQEAIAGFDAAVRLHGRLILFQFKASNWTLAGTGERRFLLEHTQLSNIVNRVRGIARSAFYVFPGIGDTLELQRHHGNFYNTSWLLDVSTLPHPFPPPTTFRGTLRRSNKHYADVYPPNVIIHSDPIKSQLSTLSSLVRSDFSDSEGLNSLLLKKRKNYSKAYDILLPLSKGTRMAILTN